MEAERLRPAFGLLTEEKSTLVACKSAVSGTRIGGGRFACPVWFWLSDIESGRAGALSEPTQHTRHSESCHDPFCCSVHDCKQREVGEESLAVMLVEMVWW